MNGLLKISLADSEGVIVALVMMDLVSSSSYAIPSLADSDIEEEAYVCGRGGGAGPLFSRCQH